MWITNVYNNYRIVNISVAKYPMRMKNILKKTKFVKILGILNSTCKPNLVQKFSKKVHNTLVLLILVYGKEIWAFIKKDAIIDISRDEIFQKNNRVHPF